MWNKTEIDKLWVRWKEYQFGKSPDGFDSIRIDGGRKFAKFLKKHAIFTKDEIELLEGFKYSFEEDYSDDLYEYEVEAGKDLTRGEIIEIWQKDLDIYESLFAKLGLKTDRAKIEKKGFEYLNRNYKKGVEKNGNK